MAENALELAKEAAKAAGEKHKELERAAAVAHSAWATASTGVAAEAMMLELGKARTLAIDAAKEAKIAADNSAAWHVAELNLQKTEEMHTQALAAASDAEAKVAQDHSGSKDERSLALQLRLVAAPQLHLGGHRLNGADDQGRHRGRRHRANLAGPLGLKRLPCRGDARSL